MSGVAFSELQELLVRAKTPIVRVRRIETLERRVLFAVIFMGWKFIGEMGRTEPSMLDGVGKVLKGGGSVMPYYGEGQLPLPRILETIGMTKPPRRRQVASLEMRPL